MEKLSYYVGLLDMSYDETVAHLLKKYGGAVDNYFSEKSYNRFMIGEIQSISKRKITRTSEGLFCHHIDEFRFQKMTDSYYIKSQMIPFDYQKKERLVYCDLVEHAVLHAQITKETNGKFGSQGLNVFLLPNIEEWYVDGVNPKLGWEINCYNKSFLNPEDAGALIDEIECYLGI